MIGKRAGTGGRAAALAGIVGLLLAAPAAADTFVPTRFDDPEPPNECKPDNCSLREALRAANNQGGADKVVLEEGTYELEIPHGGDDVALAPHESGSFDIFTPVSVVGAGPRETRIDANGLDRVITNGAGISTTGAVSLSGLMVKGGDAGAHPFTNDDGGGIVALGEKFTLKNVVVKDNAAVFGGGIYSAAEKLVIRSSTIAGNNSSEGGGIHLVAGVPQPLALIRTSTISGNTAGKGGGILADGFEYFAGAIAPILDVDNSTVAGNFASGQGGGIFGDNDSIVAVDNTTVAYNVADFDSFGGGVGGGIHQFNDASFQFSDSVLALNSVGSSGSGPACDGDFEGPGSLIDATGSNPNCNFGGLVQPSVTTVPKIGTLADNGGPTKTIKLLTGSPAIGIALGCPKLDQRGRERPDEDCDAGSFERKGP